MTQDDDQKSKRRLLVAVAGVVLLSTCFGLANYFVLKKALEMDVHEEVETIRKEVKQNTVFGTSMLQGTDDITEDNHLSYNEEGNDNENDLNMQVLLRMMLKMNSTLSSEIQHLNNDSHSLDAELEETRNKAKLLEEKLGHNKNTGVVQINGQAKGVNIPAKKNKPQKATQRTDKRVYFSVALTKTLNNLDQRYLIKFDKVFNNEGGGYDTKAGKFKVPLAGTYLFLFFVEVVNEEGKRAHVNLIINGQEKASAVAEAWHKGQEITSASSFVTYLTKGQTAWIETAQGNGTLNDIFGKRTTFSGFLISQ